MSSRSGGWKWRSSELIAFRALEDMGFEILETHKRLVIDGVEVAEIDAIARGPDGGLYAVEAKAGRIDVTAVRQAYANASLLGYKPLVVGRGFADEAAEVTARRLGVHVVLLPDAFLVDVDELERVVEEALWATIERLMEAIDATLAARPEDYRLLSALASSSTLEELSEKLGVDTRTAARMLGEARRKGLIPRGLRGFNALRGYARLALTIMKLRGLIDALTSSVERLGRLVEDLG